MAKAGSNGNGADEDGLSTAYPPSVECVIGGEVVTVRKLKVRQLSTLARIIREFPSGVLGAPDLDLMTLVEYASEPAARAIALVIDRPAEFVLDLDLPDPTVQKFFAVVWELNAPFFERALPVLVDLFGMLARGRGPTPTLSSDGMDTPTQATTPSTNLTPQ
jgi:hypothetical protein